MILTSTKWWTQKGTEVNNLAVSGQVTGLRRNASSVKLTIVPRTAFRNLSPRLRPRAGHRIACSNASQC
jgi:hypothetical protein